MKSQARQLPNTQKLRSTLKSILRARRLPVSALQILDRRPNVYSSSFPAEVVTCRLHDGTEMRLLCKYGIGYNESGYGHRGGVPYESAIYLHVLNSLRLSKPRYIGTYHDNSQGSTWLVLEYIEDTERLCFSAQPDAMKWAARWIGTFHATNEKRLRQNSLRVLKKYDHEYYYGWIRRTSRFAADLRKRFPWLPAVCSGFSELITSVLDLPPTVVHGEYTVENLLISKGKVYPTDWESAAIGFGEIDLATLTDKWPEIAPDCEREYGRARWPSGTPEGFEQTLTMARAYLQFRWLGERRVWTLDRHALWRFKELCECGRKLGLI